MRLKLMEWYTANILLVMRSPAEKQQEIEEDKGMLSLHMNVQALLDRYGASHSDPASDLLKGPDYGQSEEDELPKCPRGRSKYPPEDRERIR